MAATASTLDRWKPGIHPHAAGAPVRSLARAQLPLGEALRLELGDPGRADAVHVQYYIATPVGPWALWTSCDASELDAREAELGAIQPGFAESEPDHPARHRDRAPFDRWDAGAS